MLCVPRHFPERQTSPSSPSVKIHQSTQTLICSLNKQRGLCGNHAIVIMTTCKIAIAHTHRRRIAQAPVSLHQTRGTCWQCVIARSYWKDCALPIMRHAGLCSCEACNAWLLQSASALLRGNEPVECQALRRGDVAERSNV